MGRSTEIKGLKEVLANLKGVVDEASRPSVSAAVGVAMGAELMSETVPEAPVISGTLRRSGTVEEESDHAKAGFGVVYAARVHHGFSGKDSLGRNYNQQGNPYMVRGARKAKSRMVAAATKVVATHIQSKTK